MDANGRQGGIKNCGNCAGQAGMPPVRPGAGRVLRHWTTNVLAFRGKTTLAASDGADWGLADSRRLNLLASKLKSLSSGVGSL
jgi:hypothetical protein